jgi:hypothetical protein
MAGDPLDLFLDAITNALGVVMFILLMVVLFGRAGAEPAPVPPTQEAELRELEEEERKFQLQVQALPPTGDPELAARWKAAMQAVQRLEEEREPLLATARSTDAKVADASALLAEDLRTLERLVSQVREAKDKVRSSASGFIRVSRFQTDKRPAALLALNGGRLSRIRVTADTKQVLPPGGGSDVRDAASVKAAVESLLRDAPAGTYRVELLVWEGSFDSAKRVEAALLELGYDTNPMPAPAGAPFTPGAGGVQ